MVQVQRIHLIEDIKVRRSYNICPATQSYEKRSHQASIKEYVFINCPVVYYEINHVKHLGDIIYKNHIML